MAAAERPGVRAGRQRRARRMAYLGCAAALGYGVLKLIWSLGGTLGLRDPEVLRASLTATTRVRRFFDYWGTPILAGLAGNVGDVEVHESLPMRVVVQERAPDHRAAEQGLHRWSVSASGSTLCLCPAVARWPVVGLGGGRPSSAARG